MTAGRGSRAILALVWLISAAYVWPFHARGWIPHDEGCLAQSAERVLEGQLPHRDFDEIYTGGLAYLGAAAMRVFGRELLSLRLLLYGAFLAFVPILYQVARRFASPLVAGAATLTAVAWSFPNYFAGLPSWYNLIFTSLGALFVLKHVESGRRRHLVAAGVCGGLSFLIKVVGLYFLFGVVFFLLYREAQLPAPGDVPRRRFSPWLVLKGAVALMTPLVLLVLLRGRWKPMEIIHLAAPASAIALFVFWDEALHPKPRGTRRMRRLATLLGPLALGAAAPVALFLLLYVPGGAVGDFVRGVFLLPQRRLVSASMALPPLSGLFPAIPYAILLAAVPLGLPRRVGAALAAGLVAALLALSVVSAQYDAYRVIWLSARSLGAVAVLVGCVRLALAPDADANREVRQKVFLLLAVTACVCLQQFPFAGPIYFCYVAPVVIAALLAVVSITPPRARGIQAAVLAFYLVFAVFRLNPGYIWDLGREFRPYVADARLDFGRAGLVVPRADRDLYREVLSRVAETSRGPSMYAGPDAPEIYFMAGRKNPTRAILEFNSASPTTGLPLPVLLEDNGVTSIVINHSPDVFRATRTPADRRAGIDVPAGARSRKVPGSMARLAMLSTVMENVTVYRLWQATHAEQKLVPLRRHNELGSARRVLDVGCGPGINTALFPRAEYLGLDWNEDYIAYARRRYGREFIATDVRTFEPDRNRKFDFIFVNSFFHHIDTENTRTILRRLHELLSPGGHVHIVDLVLPERPGVARFLARMDRGEFPRPLEEWRDLFTESFETVVFEPFPIRMLGVTCWSKVYFKGARKA